MRNYIKISYKIVLVSLLLTNVFLKYGHSQTSPCVYSVSPNYMYFTNSPGSKLVSVDKDLNCRFTLTNDRSWISTSVDRKGRVYVSVTENTGATRSGTVNVAGYLVTINQSGFVPSVYSVTGGGQYCSGSPPVPVGLSGSQTNVSYQLKRNGSNYGSAINGTGSVISFGSITSSGTYTVVAIASSSGISKDMSGSKTVTVLSRPSAPTNITGDSRCGSGVVNLLVAPGTGGNQVKWYTSSGSYIQTGESYHPSISSTTTYNVKTYSSTTGCYSYARIVNGVVNPVPSVPVDIDNDANCGSGPVNLSAQPGANGDQVRWYTSGGYYLKTGSSYLSTISSTTNYKVKTYNSSTGCISSSATVTGTVNTIPSAPASIVNDASCGTGTVDLQAQPGSGGNQVRWYTSGGSFIQTGSSYSPTISTSTSYNVKTYNSTTGCLSPSSTVTGTVNTNPSAPTNITSDSRCGSGVVNLLVAPGTGGNQVKWYTSSGSYIQTGESYHPSISSTTTYNVKTYSSTTGCYSYARIVNGVVNPVPSIPVDIDNDASCGEGAVNLSAQPGANGDQVRWYTSGGYYLKTGSSYLSTISSTTNYKVKTYNSSTGCISSSATVTGTVSPIPSVPIGIVNDAVCGPGTVNLSARAGPDSNDIRWYNSGGSLIKTGTSYSPSISSTTTYKVKSYNSGTGCESTSEASVTGTVNTVPSIPSSTLSDVRCGSGTVGLAAQAGANGDQVKWYTSEGSYIQTGNSYSPTISSTTIYNVLTYNSSTGCTSLSSMVTGTVNTIPSVPINIVNGAVCGSGVVDLSAQPGTDGNTLRWYATNGTHMHTGSEYNPEISSTTTYNITTYNSATGCESSSGMAIGTVNPIPSAPTGIVNDAACGPGTVNLSAQPGTDGNDVRWYNSGGSLIKTGTSYSPTISSTKTYKVKSYNSATGCESSSEESVTGTVNTIPSVPVSIVNDEVCSAGVVDLSAQPGLGGDQVRWYTSVGSYIQTGNSYSPSISLTTDYNVKTYNSGTGCESSSGIVTGTVSPLPSGPVNIADAERSGAGSVTLSADPGDAGGVVNWYKQNENEPFHSGDSYTVNLNKNTTYIVTTSISGVECESPGVEITATITDVFKPDMTDVKSGSKNYRRKIAPKVAVKYEAELYFLENNNVIDHITYMDGLGRIEQTQAMGMGDKSDYLVQFYDYDEFGRIDTSFLPFTKQTEGAYLENLKTEQSQYYSNGSTDNISDDNSPYTTVKYEDSPLSRVMEAGTVGDYGQILPDGAGNTLKNSFETNESNIVRKWQYSFINDNYTGNTFYNAGVLNKKSLTDENNVTKTNYTDKDGKLIMVEQQGFQTYYVYDYYGRLKHILPPEFVDTLASINYTLDTSYDLFKKYCYTYVYGRRSLLVEKHLPGMDMVEYVYDKANRPVLSRNSYLKQQNKWSFVKYDQFGRIAYTGLYENVVNINGETIARDEMQNSMDLETDVYESYDFVSDEYSNNIFPGELYYCNAHTVNIYDQYPGNSKPYIDEQGNTVSNYMVNQKGKLTYTKVKVLDGSGTYLETVLYYDDYDRIIQKQSDNINGKVDVYSYTYNFSGQVTGERIEHVMPDNSIEDVRKYYTYDDAGRLSTIEQEIGADTNGKIKMLEMEYNKLGQLISKRIHDKGDGNFLQNVDYQYNIRGQLTRINDPDNQRDDLFAMKIYYTDPVKPGGTASKNGMVSGIEWIIFNSQVETKKRAYEYAYDDHYRLVSAQYSEGTGPDENIGRYDAYYSYTANGKINSLLRYGKQDDLDYGVIDSLFYTYDGNQLIRVLDRAENGLAGFKDSGHDITDYTYDLNGNMVSDANKGIDTILYNHLNLPEQVIFDSDNFITFTYDAAGNKLKKVVTQDAVVDTYDYIGLFEYHNRELKKINTVQGQVEITGTEYKYNYFLKDHLGSIRVVFSQDMDNTAKIEQESHYYPYGMRIDGLSVAGTEVNDMLFTGKQLNNEIDLNWYDFGARNYDAALGMWFNTDPMLEKYHSVTPYNYCFNNPVNLTDPNGMDPLYSESYQHKDPNAGGGNDISLPMRDWGLYNKGYNDCWWSIDLWLESIIEYDDITGVYRDGRGDVIPTEEALVRINTPGNIEETYLPFGYYVVDSDGNEIEGTRVVSGFRLAQATRNENSGKGAFSIGLSGGVTVNNMGYGAGIGIFVGATTSGIYITKKKGEGVMLSVSADLTGYRSKTGNYVELNDLSYKGFEVDFGAWILGYTRGNNGYIEYDGSIVPPTYDAHTISISDGMDFGYSNWDTETIVIPKTPWIGTLIPKLPW